jgi:protein phosphatase
MSTDVDLAVETVVSAYAHLISSIVPDQSIHIGSWIPIPCFSNAIIEAVIDAALLRFKGQPIVLDLDLPCVVVGDIHGNLQDLVRILASIRGPPHDMLLFLGHYVDRGQYSLDVLLLLFSFTVYYPRHVFLLRGNHEFRWLNADYGFRAEMVCRFGDDRLWSRFQDVFAWIPMGAVLGERILCLHGGIGPNFELLHALRSYERPIEDYHSNPLIADVVWSDPNPGEPFYKLSERGTGALFGEGAVQQFLHHNHLTKLVRAHQCYSYGIQNLAKGLCVTVFSCSNYVDRGNSGAFACINNSGNIDAEILEARVYVGRQCANFVDVELLRRRPNLLCMRSLSHVRGPRKPGK